MRYVVLSRSLMASIMTTFSHHAHHQMHKALSYLGTLPDDTITYVGHEYTSDNFKFAASVRAGHLAGYKYHSPAKISFAGGSG